MSLPAVVAIAPARAQTYTTLYAFAGGPDGASPIAGVILDSVGNLYGTTYCGGIPSQGGACGGALGYGVVFKLDATGKETTLHRFTGGADGAIPQGVLVRDAAGNLYGATQAGGLSPAPDGYGIVFRLDPIGEETVLHSFTGGSDGGYPTGVIRDSAGDLYGTAEVGGGGQGGVAFELNSTGEETVLYSFANSQSPYTGLLRDSAGSLLGVSNPADGAVFELDTAGTETVLHMFTGNAKGAWPQAPVIRDSAGNLYGTTELGGTADYPDGYGVVFKLNRTGKETVLYTFTGGADGGQPWAALIRDSAGNLYGTTNGGGAWGYGVVFKLDTNGNETVLYSFTGGADGGSPYAGLVQDSAGNLYGTTPIGGTVNATFPRGCGVVFKITF